MNDFDNKKMNDITRGEAWLAGFYTPEASSDLIERIKRATRDELARPTARRTLFTLRPWHGSFAAAAMLAVCVGVAWYSKSHTHLAPGPMADAEPSVAAASVPDEVDALFFTFESAEQGISDLDELAYDDAWSLDGVSLYTALDDAFDDDSGQDGAGDIDGTSMLNRGQTSAAEGLS